MLVQIRVFCRVRPSPKSVISCQSDGVSVRVEGQGDNGKDASFSFDHVFAPSSSQADVFAAVSDLVQSALDGYNVSTAPE